MLLVIHNKFVEKPVDRKADLRANAMGSASNACILMKFSLSKNPFRRVGSEKSITLILKYREEAEYQNARSMAVQ